MTFEERVQAVAAEKFGPAEAGLLTARRRSSWPLVMLHAGVCMKRQYLTLHRTAVRAGRAGLLPPTRGRRPGDALRGDARARRGCTTCIIGGCTPRIGEPHSRLRKPVAVGRAMERLMVLDAVLRAPRRDLARDRGREAGSTSPQRLGTGRAARVVAARHVRRRAAALVRRYFAERLPIAVEDDGRRAHVRVPGDAAVARGPPGVPPQPRGAAARHCRAGACACCCRRTCSGAEHACRPPATRNSATPLRPAVIEEIRWYFEQRRALDAGRHAAWRSRTPRVTSARRAPSRRPGIRALYRAWRRHGPRILRRRLPRPTLADALERRVGAHRMRGAGAALPPSLLPGRHRMMTRACSGRWAAKMVVGPVFASMDVPPAGRCQAAAVSSPW